MRICVSALCHILRAVICRAVKGGVLNLGFSQKFVEVVYRTKRAGRGHLKRWVSNQTLRLLIVGTVRDEIYVIMQDHLVTMVTHMHVTKCGLRFFLEQSESEKEQRRVYLGGPSIERECHYCPQILWVQNASFCQPVHHYFMTYVVHFVGFFGPPWKTDKQPTVNCCMTCCLSPH